MGETKIHHTTNSVAFKTRTLSIYNPQAKKTPLVFSSNLNVSKDSC